MYLRALMLILVVTSPAEANRCRDEGFGRSRDEAISDRLDLKSRGFNLKTNAEQVQTFHSTSYPSVNRLIQFAWRRLRRNVALASFTRQSTSDANYLYLKPQLFLSSRRASPEQIDAAVSVAILEGLASALRAQSAELETNPRLEIYVPGSRDRDEMAISFRGCSIEIQGHFDLIRLTHLASGRSSEASLDYNTQPEAYAALVHAASDKLRAMAQTIETSLERMRPSQALAQARMSPWYAGEIVDSLQNLISRLEQQFVIYHHDIP